MKAGLELVRTYQLESKMIDEFINDFAIRYRGWFLPFTVYVRSTVQSPTARVNDGPFGSVASELGSELTCVSLLWRGALARRSETSFRPRTELGRRLWEIRQRIVRSGVDLLDWNGIEREVRMRRGE